ncbi:uncharacterized protein LOC111039411 [Myzus persicae]|uniref:uncharacterized protein LOC111039411 n=1 Tax=Myzus persicae TaxID=13164 RepID=UPI000B932A4F|nr:uncharacterized protein LOC111039411 [Myzus persicae]
MIRVRVYLTKGYLVIHSKQKRLVIDLYKTKKANEPNILFKQLIRELMSETGLGKNSIEKIISEYKTRKTVSSPNMNKIRPKIFNRMEDFDKNAIRQIVHTFWRNRDPPTLNKIVIAVSEDDSLPTIKRTTMYALLKELNFEYTKRKRNGYLTERKDLIVWRRNYLRSIKAYREEGRTLYYLDETWCNADDCSQKVLVDNTIKPNKDAYQEKLTTGAKNPTEKGKRLIVAHIGSRKGFVNGGLLCYESETNCRDYHHEMNGDSFLKWFTHILPLLDDNSVIIMDSTPHHSMTEEKIPVSSWKKQDIMEWLKQKNIPVDNSYAKAELMNLVRKHKPEFEKYVVDEVAKAENKIVLRLPPYHYELNPIELAWSKVKGYVKNRNTTFKLNDVKQLLIEGVEAVTEENWRCFDDHAIKEESKFWEIDSLIDDFLENDFTRAFNGGTGDTSSDNTDSL